MNIDGNALEKQALEHARKGEMKEFFACQDEFLRQVAESGEDYCSCTTKCKVHGKCVECVLIHRGHQDHLPACFRDMVNRKIAEICRLTEARLEKPSAKE